MFLALNSFKKMNLQEENIKLLICTYVICISLTIHPHALALDILIKIYILVRTIF